MSSVSVTIVVLSLVGGAALERCLAAVARIPARRIVMARAEVAEQHSGRWRQFEWLPTAASVPDRRARGLALATTEWVALIEDTCEPAPAWFDAMSRIAATRAGAAWGGPVLIAGSLPPRFLALACTEYSEFTPANWRRLAIGAAEDGAGRMPRIAGLNLVYRRSALAGLDLADGVVESDLHPELQRRGESLCLHPDLAVTYFASGNDNASTAARYKHGRIYGGGLAGHLPPGRRMLGALKCLALPGVLSLRALRGLPRDYRSRSMALAWIVAFSSAWACGELVGILAGRGDSIRSWA